MLHIMASETYPRIKFEKFHLGSYNAEDTDVNAVKQRLQIFCKLYATKELTLKVLKQIKNSERIVSYAVKADFTTKHF